MKLKNITVSNGSSQNNRFSKKLAANYISVEERSIEQLLSFVQAYADNLTYYNTNNLADGTWLSFFNQQDFNIQDLIAYLKDPVVFQQDPQKLARYSQPHIGLLLTFLQLLEHPQQQFRDLTQRHLDFYYKTVLRLPLKPPKPDQVNVIVTLEDNVDFYQLNKGTLLTAGQDSLGNDLIYSLDEDIVVSQAQLARVETLSVKKLVTETGVSKVVGILPTRVYDVETKLEFDNSGFATFGDVSLDEKSETEVWPQYPIHMGFIVSSPVLLLESGTREISLTLSCLFADINAVIAPDIEPFSAELLGKFCEYFTIELSGVDQWLTPTIGQTRVTELSRNDNGYIKGHIEFTLSVSDSEMAITLPSAELAPELQLKHPALRFLLKPLVRDAQDNTNYQLLKNVWLEKIDLAVTVQGLKNLRLRSDDGSLDIQSPFQPFGSFPLAGNGFYFANAELCSKKLDELELAVEWMELPNDFKTYYQAYSDTEVFKEKYKKDGQLADGITNTSFKTSLKLYDNNRLQLIANEKSLFGQVLESSAILVYPELSNFNYEVKPIDTSDDELLNWKRYFKLELASPDFMHSLYALVVSENANSMMYYQMAPEEYPKPATVYPAYTPQLKNFSVAYKTHTSIDLQRITQGDEQQIIQINPTGVTDINKVTVMDPMASVATELYPLLPRYAAEASLYLGFSQLLPPQNLAVLFQMVPSSGNSSIPKPAIKWSYLVNDSWQELNKSDILLDTTNGLLDSGILRFAIPMDATPSQQLFSGGLYWVKADIEKNSAAIGKTLDIKTQVVSATFIDQNNAADHLSKPLAANTITDLVDSDPLVKSIQQPYPSTKGRMAEDDTNFTVRVSERLRHKQRGLTSWDYERLVLERFPEIYKVRCITQTGQAVAYDPAKVVLIVIPNVANTELAFVLKPKAPLYLLEDIKNYLSDFLPPFVKLEVKNPIYQELSYRVGVKFFKEYEQGNYVKRLNDELIQFLTPWAYAQQADIDFGSVLHSSSVIQFIEQRPYVDYVVSLSLTQAIPSADGSGAVQLINSSSGLAQTESPEVILVSAPTHTIDMLSGTKQGYVTATTGIGYFKIGDSFYIA